MADARNCGQGDAVPDCEEALFKELAGRHGAYYLAIRRRMAARDNELVWNWWAFLLNVFWLLMKRMWGAAVVVCAAYGLFYFVCTRFVFTGALLPGWASPQALAAAILLLQLALIFGVPLFCGLFGNKLYVTYINARVRARLKTAGR